MILKNQCTLFQIIVTILSSILAFFQIQRFFCHGKCNPVAQLNIFFVGFDMDFKVAYHSQNQSKLIKSLLINGTPESPTLGVAAPLESTYFCTHRNQRSYPKILFQTE